MQESPKRGGLPTFERDVLVPAGHALIGGIIGAVTIALLSLWGAVSGLWGTGAALLAGATGGALIAAVIWGWLIIDRNELLWAAERVVGDLDGDGIAGKPKSKYPAMPGPSGNDVLLKDLGAFAKLAPDDKAGTSFQGFWSERWPHEYWGDVMDIWAAHRCVEARRQRHKSKWLAKSYEEAIARLFSTYANRPTP
jgi:hypothetical protein